jgi:glucose-6-phosphate dehydrogenase assembly protein OpcA
LIPDLPVFLLYLHGFDPASPEFTGMARLADRVIVDSAASEQPGECIRSVAGMLREEDAPAFGDLQWVALSPWRSLLANLFEPPERVGMLRQVERVELKHAPDGTCRALLLVGWLADSLGWTLQSATESSDGREIHFDRPDGGEVVVAVSESSEPEEYLRRIRLYAGDYSYQVSRHREQTDARTTVMHGDELVGERTVHLGALDLSVLVGEELHYRGRDAAYEGALRKAAEVLEL